MILSVLTALPVVGALATLALGHNKNSARMTALLFSLATLALTIFLWVHFDHTSGAMQFNEQHAWVPAISAEYRLGVDGLGLLMLLLSAIVTPIGIAASWQNEQITDRTSLYYALVLVLESCLIGSFTALNFIHWFTFWELALVPAFFLIKLWGGPKRTAAATQFLVYTMVGSVAMLLSFLALFLATHQFDFAALASLAQGRELMPAVLNSIHAPACIANHLPLLLFLGVFLGFAVKVPLIPFHTWLPAAYSEAPTGTTILLTGAMSKMGVYGFLRILLPIFGAQVQQYLTPLLWLSVATVILSVYAAMAQKDLKRVFAYSSINHLGYCMLGAFAVLRATGSDPNMLTQKYAALSGVMLQTFNHGLTAAAVFWFIALLEKRSGGLRSLEDFGGLRQIVPVFAGLMGIALFSSLGLPGLNGFVGEFLIFKGVFPLATWAAAISVLGLMVTAIVILTVIQKLFTGPLNPRWAAMPDLTPAERLALAPLIALMFALGLYPQLVLGAINPTVVQLVQHLQF